jgi:hypothetical protein
MITHPVTTYAMTQQDSSSSNLRYPAWQREYEASLHEPDPKKLLERVHAVEAAIFNPTFPAPEEASVTRQGVVLTVSLSIVTR